MKKITRFLAGASALFMLSGCAVFKCDYAKFKEKYDAAETREIEKTTLKGTYNGEDFSFSYEKVTDVALKNLGIVTAYATCSALIAGYAASESESATYYYTTSFKVVDGDNTYEWNKNLNLTKVVTKDLKLTASYTYAK